MQWTPTSSLGPCRRRSTQTRTSSGRPGTETGTCPAQTVSEVTFGSPLETSAGGVRSDVEVGLHRTAHRNQRPTPEDHRIWSPRTSRVAPTVGCQDRQHPKTCPTPASVVCPSSGSGPRDPTPRNDLRPGSHHSRPRKRRVDSECVGLRGFIEKTVPKTWDTVDAPTSVDPRHGTRPQTRSSHTARQLPYKSRDTRDQLGPCTTYTVD